MNRFLLTAVALTTLTGTAAAQNRTQEHRMWAAEQMINRVIALQAQSISACQNPDLLDFRPKLSEACVNAVTSATPIIGTIRQVAATGDDNQWAKIIGIVHTLEADIARSRFQSSVK
jgi:hypothetical protein